MSKTLTHALHLLATAATALCLAACEVHIGDQPLDEREATRELCRYVWQTSYTAYDGAYVDHFLTFYPNGTGMEEIYSDYPHASYVDRFDFDWRWTSWAFSSIEMRYGPGDYLYMDNIWLSGGMFSCYFDGQMMTFRSYY